MRGLHRFSPLIRFFLPLPFHSYAFQHISIAYQHCCVQQCEFMTNRKLAAWRPTANAAAATIFRRAYSFLHPCYCGASVALAREQRQHALHRTSSQHRGRLLLLNCVLLLRSKFSFSAEASACLYRLDDYPFITMRFLSATRRRFIDEHQSILLDCSLLLLSP